jgi:hypothetical protein
MFEAIKPLIDNGILNEETRTVLESAWNNKLDEARESIRAEIREEMAQRYEHDKTNIVEALDRMVNDTLTAEVTRLAEERAALEADRVAQISKLKSKASVFESFVKDRLKSELSEFRNDRANYEKAIARLESFIAENLRREISEFQQDKEDLARHKVAVVKEGKEQLAKLREGFIKKSSHLVESAVKSTLRNELTQLKSDINEARENNFGRKIFEAFATEFSATHLNERAEIKKLLSSLGRMESQLVEARNEAEAAKVRASQKEREINRIMESATRQKKLDELLKPLSREKADIMKSLLESTATDKLDVAFKKYLKPVMEGAAPQVKQNLVETHTEVTGDRAASADQLASMNNIVEIRRLAGLVKN